jgi:hypothetical protein
MAMKAERGEKEDDSTIRPEGEAVHKLEPQVPWISQMGADPMLTKHSPKMKLSSRF